MIAGLCRVDILCLCDLEPICQCDDKGVTVGILEFKVRCITTPLAMLLDVAISSVEEGLISEGAALTCPRRRRDDGSLSYAAFTPEAATKGDKRKQLESKFYVVYESSEHLQALSRGKNHNPTFWANHTFPATQITPKYPTLSIGNKNQKSYFTNK